MDTIDGGTIKIKKIVLQVHALCDEMEEIDCHRVRDIIEHITNRWALSALCLLSEAKGPLRFSQLQKQMDGVTQKVLTQTLRMLEKNGFVTRKVYAQVPPRVDYQITSLGIDMLAHILPAWVWVAGRLTDFVQQSN